MKNKHYILEYHEGINRYLSENHCSFHMPGHKGQYLTKGIEGNILPAALFPYDITASYEREDLYNPKTFLKKSLDNLTEIYGTVRSYYLVNGSTGGNQAALIATLNPGDKILMPRNIHKLIYGALVATQAKPIYMGFSANLQNNPLLSGIDPQKIEDILNKDPEIKVVYLVNPSYTGVCSDISEIIRIAHAKNKIVIVDEAHGAHFFFHEDLPQSAISAGADIVIQSAHKTLNALSQTALLHICSDRVDKARVELTISMFQTTSPNTILLLSVEAAVIQMANQGRTLLDKTLEQARYVRKRIACSAPLLCCYDKKSSANPYVAAMDETKLYINVSSLGLTGYTAKSLVSKADKVEAELADYRHVLFSLTIADSFDDVKKLVEALIRLSSKTYGEITPTEMSLPNLPVISPLTPAQVFYAPKEDLPLSQSAGRICAEMITPYPPGIPALMPGEVINNEWIDYLNGLMSIKAHFGGSKYNDLSRISVVKEV